MKKVLGLVVCLGAAALMPAAGQEADPAVAPPWVITPPEEAPTLLAPGDLVWFAREEHPAARYRDCGTSDGTHFYVFGGWANGSVANTAYRYDPATNSWEQLADMPVANSNMGCAYYPAQNKIYIPGGYNGSSALNGLYIYDIDNDSWSTGASMPTSAYGTVCAVVEDSLFVLCGRTFYRYDIPNNSWATRASKPLGSTAGHGAMTVYDGEIYHAGGWTADIYAYRYTPTANTWTRLANLKTGRHGLGVEAAAGKIYAYAGGNSWSYFYNTVEVYDPANPGLGWQYETPMLERHLAGAFACLVANGQPWLHAATGLSTGSERIKYHERGIVPFDHNLAADRILKPDTICRDNIPLNPEVRVINWGKNTESFDATLWIDSSGVKIYDETVSGLNLNKFDTLTVTFPEWTPSDPGNFYDLTAFTVLATDENPLDDTCKLETQSVLGYDVGVDSILAPPDTLYTGYDYVPGAVVKNHTLFSQEFDATCRVDTGGVTVYESAVACTLDPEASKEVSFDTLTTLLPAGVLYDIAFFTDLVGDEVPGNDTLTIQAIAIGDVTPVSIEEPPEEVYTETWYSVIALISNLTEGTTEEFWVYANIDSLGEIVYESIVETSLDPGETQMAAFDDWFTGEEPGITYLLTVWTELPNDMDTYNDTLTLEIITKERPSHDVAAVEILAPPDTCWVDTTYIPQARVHNFGNQTETFEVYAQLLFGETEVYADTQAVAGLEPDSSREVSFKEWVPSDSNGYTFTVWTVLAGDADPANDSIAKSIWVKKWIGISDQVGLPEHFFLSPAQPNPVSGITRISYDIAARVPVGIRVYDITGKLVKTLVASGGQEPGHYNLTWDLRDDLGRRVARGVYFIRIETPKYAATRKLILVH